MKDFVISKPTKKVIVIADGVEDNVVLMIADIKNASIIEMELSEFDMIAIRDHLTARLDEIYDNALAEII